jgi:hypothetical protein
LGCPHGQKDGNRGLIARFNQGQFIDKQHASSPGFGR